MLAKLLRLYQEYGSITHRLILSKGDMLSPYTYIRRFTSLDQAYQALSKELIERRRSEIVATLKNEDFIIERIDDLLVIDNYFSLTIQPTVPIPQGYEASWLFHPDDR